MPWTSMLAALSLLPAAGPAAQAPPADPVRPALAAFERVLDRAVGRVSAPSPFAMLTGPGGSHGYHLKGQGAFFVLPARRLPVRPHVMMFRFSPGPVLEGPEGEALARQIAALHEEAERATREADRSYRQVRREIYVRSHSSNPDANGSAGPAPAPAAAPSPDDAAPPTGVDELPAPPWHFWFEADAPEPAAGAGADELVARVRGAIADALESDAALLPMVAPDEFVAVAVDFVADPFFATGVEHPRTLVVRAQRRDLAARRAGRLSAEQFRERLSYEEY